MTGLRYLLAVPRPTTASLVSHAPALIEAPGDRRSDQPTLWISDPSSVSIDPISGICLIGTLFDRVTSQRIHDAAEVAAVMRGRTAAACARRLIAQAWGAYIALIQAGPDCHLLRSPMGQLPCYRARAGTHDIFASDARLLLDANLLTPAINWAALDGHLRWPDRRAVDTCLKGLSECPPGAIVEIGKDQPRAEFLWTPLMFTAPASPTPTPAVLHEVICATVAAWTRDAEHVVVPASGGLDSSIVCAALAAAHRPFTCVTMATADPSGDERAYVNCLANALAAPVVARVFDQGAIDLTRSASDHLPRPNRKPFMQQSERVMRGIAASVGAPFILDGNGGDNVFCFLHASLPIVDRLRSEGLGRGALTTLFDVCRLTRADLGTVMRMVLRHVAGRGPRRGAKRDDRFLATPNGHVAPPAALTPWLDDGSGQLPGKLAHIDLIARIQNHVDGYPPDGAPPVLSPLLSQPIVEYCLSVPSWHWCAGGVNRSFAREAFRDDLPATILSRISKAGPDSFITRLFLDNRTLLRTQLCHGQLADHGLIDPLAVEAAIADPATGTDDGILRLLDLSEAEAWVRSWLGN